LKIEAALVVSAATARDLPRDGLPEVALVGRSNVGKSSLINALVRRPLARTSAAPGKTRLANVYRLRRGAARAFYLVDLPGYGFARGDRDEIDAIARMYFGASSACGTPDSSTSAGSPRAQSRDEPRTGKSEARRGGLLLIDSRHPGLQPDVEAWKWLRATVSRAAIVATKIDKLSRSERQRATKTNEAVFEHPVLPVSAETGEGLDELWKLIDRLTKPA
jgi:GTP-binding protein